MYNLLTIAECTQGHIEHMQRDVQAAAGPRNYCVLVCVLDGAPEALRGRDPEGASTKCYNFRTHAQHNIRQWDGTVLTSNGPRIHWIDGCVAWFSDRGSLPVGSAITAAHALHCALKAHNEYLNHSWECQLHARAAIAPSVGEALAFLQYPQIVTRNETGVHMELWETIPHATRCLMVHCNVRSV